MANASFRRTSITRRQLYIAGLDRVMTLYHFSNLSIESFIRRAGIVSAITELFSLTHARMTEVAINCLFTNKLDAFRVIKSGSRAGTDVS